jgi:hypothetical protein
MTLYGTPLALQIYNLKSINLKSISLVRNHPQDFWQIGIADHGCHVQFAFPLRVLRGQDVAQKSLAALYLPRRSLLEALGSAFVCFQFRHKSVPVLSDQFLSSRLSHSAVSPLSTQRLRTRSGNSQTHTRINRVLTAECGLLGFPTLAALVPLAAAVVAAVAAVAVSQASRPASLHSALGSSAACCLLGGVGILRSPCRLYP